jgi:hypothetical protein
MGQDRLSALAMCSIEKELIQNTENFNELVTNHLNSQKNRRFDWGRYLPNSTCFTYRIIVFLNQFVKTSVSEFF